MKAAIAAGHFQHSRIVTLTFSTGSPNDGYPNRSLQEDEIELDGKMYDVVSAQREGNRIVVQAISDDDETSLANAYQQAISGKQSSLPDKNTTCLKGFFSPFIVNAVQTCLQPLGQIKSNTPPSVGVVVPAGLSARVLTPPPRLA